MNMIDMMHDMYVREMLRHLMRKDPFKRASAIDRIKRQPYFGTGFQSASGSTLTIRVPKRYTVA